MNGRIGLKFKHDLDLDKATINVKYEYRLVEIKKENKTTIIPFESVDMIEFETDGDV